MRWASVRRGMVCIYLLNIWGEASLGVVGLGWVWSGEASLGGVGLGLASFG